MIFSPVRELCREEILPEAIATNRHWSVMRSTVAPEGREGGRGKPPLLSLPLYFWTPPRWSGAPWPGRHWLNAMGTGRSWGGPPLKSETSKGLCRWTNLFDLVENFKGSSYILELHWSPVNGLTVNPLRRSIFFITDWRIGQCNCLLKRSKQKTEKACTWLNCLTLA